MSAGAMQPVSGSNLAAALGGGGSATGTGGKPVSADNLRAVLEGGLVALETLWECDPSNPKHNALAPLGYDVYVVDVEVHDDDTNAVIGDAICVAVDGAKNQDDYMYGTSDVYHMMTVYGISEDPPVFRPQQSDVGISRYFDRFLRVRGGYVR